MKFKRQNTSEDDINLTPLIDVVFMLLIFFMVSTTFTKETHLKVDLPEAVGEPGIKPSEPLEILINTSGEFSLNGRALVNSQIGTLKKALTEITEGDTERPLIITADAQTPHQAVVTAMDAAGQLGFVRLSMTTRKPSDE